MIVFRSLAIFAAVAVAVLESMIGPAVASVTAASASTRHAQVRAVTRSVTVNGVSLTCTTPNQQFAVNASHIHIRSTPDGTVAYSISQGALYDSDWYFASSPGEYYCVTKNKYGGQYWVYGYSNATPSHIGYVGLNYLNAK
ncbi:MAG: hypothetical protein ACRDRJ_12675 [Streptosporangiaceae bacterium]